MKKIRLYRIENTDSSKWVWYNPEWKFDCTVKELECHPMPYEPDVYKWIYKSSVRTSKDLTYRVPKKVAQKLIKDWFIFCRYLSDDYFFREHGEICFNKTNYYKKEILDLDKFYD